jgi:WD40 repeat protein
MTNGGVSIVDGTTLAFVKWVKTFDSPVPDVKYSPDGQCLAAASHDLFIDVFSVTQNYTKIGAAP